MKVNIKAILTVISFIFGISFIRLLKKQKQTSDKLQEVKKQNNRTLNEYKDYKRDSEKLFKLEREIINNLEKKAFNYDLLKGKYDNLQNSFKELYKQSLDIPQTKEEPKKTVPQVRTEFKNGKDELNYKKELANYFNTNIHVINNWFYKPKNKYKGVLYREKHFEAQLQFNGKTLSKCFKTEIEAALQYNKWVDEYRLGHGFKNIILEQTKKPEQLSIIEQKNLNPDFEKIAKEFNIPNLKAFNVKTWYEPPKPPQKYKGVSSFGKYGYRVVFTHNYKFYCTYAKTEELAAAEYNNFVREHRKGYGYLNKIE